MRCFIAWSVFEYRTFIYKENKISTPILDETPLDRIRADKLKKDLTAFLLLSLCRWYISLRFDFSYIFCGKGNLL
jgi:hypothetical protein